VHDESTDKDQAVYGALVKLGHSVRTAQLTAWQLGSTRAVVFDGLDERASLAFGPVENGSWHMPPLLRLKMPGGAAGCARDIVVHARAATVPMATPAAAVESRDLASERLESATSAVYEAAPSASMNARADDARGPR
jgi:hypothetical protein